MTENFEAASAQASIYQFNGANDAVIYDQVQTGLDGGNSITYDADTDSFTLTITQGPQSFEATFSPADILPGYPPEAVGYRDGDVFFTLANPEATGLSYVNYGSWSLRAPSGGFTQGALIYGVRTPAEAVPNSGTASFTGSVGGVMVEDRKYYGLRGKVDLSVDFGAGTVAGEFKDMTTSFVGTDVTAPWHDLTLNATISGNGFDGTLQAKDSDLAGTASGGFFGPGAAEIGGSWRATNDTTGAIGTFTGKRP